MGGPLQVWVSGSKQEVGSCLKAAFRNIRGGASRSSIEGTRGNSEVYGLEVQAVRLPIHWPVSVRGTEVT